MTTTKHITRRRFLGWAAIISIPFAGLLNRISPTSSVVDSELHQVSRTLVNALFQDHKNATQLGEAYMQQFPNEHDLTSLLNILFEKKPSLSKVAANNNNDALTPTLQQLITEDFEHGDIVNIDGWIVARTEARLSAIAKFV